MELPIRVIDKPEHCKGLHIHYKPIHFINQCAVSGVYEVCEIEIEYTPSSKLLEIQSFRKCFEQPQHSLIEQIASDVKQELQNKLSPIDLKVVVRLIDNKLTPWEVVA